MYIPLSLFTVELKKKNYLPRIFQFSCSERLCAIHRSCNINHSVGSRRLAAETRGALNAQLHFAEFFYPMPTIYVMTSRTKIHVPLRPSDVNNALEQGTRNELVRETINQRITQLTSSQWRNVTEKERVYRLILYKYYGVNVFSNM